MSQPATQHKRATYPAYRPSGIEWLGEIPEHWKVLSFKRLGDFQGGAGFPNDEQGCEENELPFYKVSDTNLPGNEIFMIVHNNAVSRETSRKLRAYIFPRETIVFAKVGAALLLNKRRILTQPACIDNNMMGFMRRTCELMWAYFWMCSLDLGELANPGAVPSINEGQIREIKVPVPSLDEQRAIAAFLDRETARIDALIDKKQRQIELLQEKRSALISHAVTKGLDPDAKMKDSGIEWLGQIPAHWGTRRLRYLGYCQNGINIGAEKFGTGYPFVSYGDVYNNSALPVVGSGLVESSDADRTRYSVETGDVFFTRTSETIEEIGFSSVCFKTIPDAVFAGFLIRFRPVGKTLNIGFSEFHFRSDHLRAFFVKEMNLVTRASLSQDLLKDMPVLLPPIEEQAQIASILNQKMTQITSLIQKIQDSIVKLQEHRTALISAAVTGKIDVRKEASA